MADYDTFSSGDNFFGDGMPHGNKNAGFVGLMIAKEQSRTPRSYGNQYPTSGKKIPKKRIPKLDINRVGEPSDYLKLAYIDDYNKSKTHFKAPAVKPKTRDEAIVALADKGMSTREISATLPKLGFEASQPTVVRTLQRLKKKSEPVGSGKEVGGNFLTSMANATQTLKKLGDRYKNDKDFRNKALMAMNAGEVAYKLGKDALKGGAGIRFPTIATGIPFLPRIPVTPKLLMMGLGKRGKGKDDELDEEDQQLYNELMSSDNPAVARRVYRKSQEEADNAYSAEFNSGGVSQGTRAYVDKLAKALYEWEKFRDLTLKSLQESSAEYSQALHDNEWKVPQENPGETPNFTEAEQDVVYAMEAINENKKDLFKSLQVIKQIKRAIASAVLRDRNADDPQAELPVLDEQGELFPMSNMHPREPWRQYRPGENYIVQEEKEAEDNPTGSGKPILKLYTTSGKPYHGKYHIMDNGEVHTGKKHGKRSKKLVIQ